MLAAGVHGAEAARAGAQRVGPTRRYPVAWSSPSAYRAGPMATPTGIRRAARIDERHPDDCCCSVPLVVLQLGLMIAGLSSTSARAGSARRGDRASGRLIIVFVNLIGPILYFVVGREERSAQRRPERRPTTGRDAGLGSPADESTRDVPRRHWHRRRPRPPQAEAPPGAAAAARPR